MRVGFAGTPDFAIPALESLCNSRDIHLACVYTQPDRPAGRGRQVSMSPVKQFALARDLTILQPKNFSDKSSVDELRTFSLDVLVVAAYGLILPQDVLDAVKFPINIHASLLPRWRGAAPIQRAIIAGDTETGITIIRIIKKLDAGPIWLQSTCKIDPRDTASSLHDKLATLGADTVNEALIQLSQGKINECDQDETLVTYAEKITSGDRDLDWRQSGQYLLRKIRALNPTPVATTTLAGQKCKIWEASSDDANMKETRSANPGDIVYARNDGIGICVKDGVLKLTSIQPPGKKPMRVQDFLNGYGSRLKPATT